MGSDHGLDWEGRTHELEGLESERDGVRSRTGLGRKDARARGGERARWGQITDATLHGGKTYVLKVEGGEQTVRSDHKSKCERKNEIPFESWEASKISAVKVFCDCLYDTTKTNGRPTCDFDHEISHDIKCQVLPTLLLMT